MHRYIQKLRSNISHRKTEQCNPTLYTLTTRSTCYALWYNLHPLCSHAHIQHQNAACHQSLASITTKRKRTRRYKIGKQVENALPVGTVCCLQQQKQPRYVSDGTQKMILKRWYSKDGIQWWNYVWVWTWQWSMAIKWTSASCWNLALKHTPQFNRPLIVK